MTHRIVDFHSHAFPDALAGNALSLLELARQDAGGEAYQSLFTKELGLVEPVP